MRRWKAKLLGNIEEELIGQCSIFNLVHISTLSFDHVFMEIAVADQKEPEVIFHSVGIVSDGNEEIVIPLPIKECENQVMFTLKEGTRYRLKLRFSVQYNIVSGLIYKNTIWKGRRKGK